MIDLTVLMHNGILGVLATKSVPLTDDLERPHK